MAVVWRELCPCLNPFGLTGKRPVGPERSEVVLRPFNPFDFFRMGDTGFFTLLCLLALSCGRTGKKPGHGGKKTVPSYQVRKVKNSAVLGPGCISGGKR
jgi:hypothetical protein